MEFFDQRKGWLPEWTSTNQLPRLVRVALAFGKEGRISRAPEDVTIRVIPMGNSITRIGARTESTVSRLRACGQRAGRSDVDPTVPADTFAEPGDQRFVLAGLARNLCASFIPTRNRASH